MDALALTRNTLHKENMEYNDNLGNNLGWIQHIDIMSIIEIFYTTCCLVTQTVAPTLPDFQGLKRCIQYLAIHPHKPIFYSSSYYDG